MEQTVTITLISTNATFDEKHLNIPISPAHLLLGRHFDPRTTPTPTNGFFDSKVISKQHAEVWAEPDGKLWIRGLEMSNGTFVNGLRLAAENRISEPHELRQRDILELGVDIVGESRVYSRVSARVEIAGLVGDTTRALES